MHYYIITTCNFGITTYYFDYYNFSLMQRPMTTYCYHYFHYCQPQLGDAPHGSTASTA